MKISPTKVLLLCSLGAAFALANAAPLPLPAAKAPPTPQASKSSKRKAPAKRSRARRPAAQNAPAPARIKEIQSALQREGALTAEPTGNWDAASIEAMKRYQTEQGLNPTGKIDALTLQKLGLGSEVAGKGAPVAAAAPGEADPHAAH